MWRPFIKLDRWLDALQLGLFAGWEPAVIEIGVSVGSFTLAIGLARS